MAIVPVSNSKDLPAEDHLRTLDDSSAKHLSSIIDNVDSISECQDPHELRKVVHALLMKILQLERELANKAQLIAVMDKAANLFNVQSASMKDLFKTMKAVAAGDKKPAKQKSSGTDYEDWVLTVERVQGPTMMLAESGPPVTQVWLFTLAPPVGEDQSSDTEHAGGSGQQSLTLLLAKDALNLAGLPEDKVAGKTSLISNAFGQSRGSSRLKSLELNAPMKALRRELDADGNDAYFDKHAAKTKFVELEVMSQLVNRIAENMMKETTDALADGGKLEWLRPDKVQQYVVLDRKQWQIQKWMQSLNSKNKAPSEPTADAE